MPKQYGADSFPDLLIKMTDQAPVTGQETLTSLTAKEALALSHKMAMQMNESLLDILSDRGGEHQPSDTSMDGFEEMLYQQATGKGALSKIRQVPSETDLQDIQTKAPVAEKKEKPKPIEAHGIEGIVQEAANAFGVDSELIKGVIQAESSFNPNAVSPKGAMGLMQLMPETAKELGVNDPFNPAENVMGGTRYLKKLLDRYEGSVPLALAAYNWGMGNLDSRRSQMPAETKRYVAKITGIALT